MSDRNTLTNLVETLAKQQALSKTHWIPSIKPGGNCSSQDSEIIHASKNYSDVDYIAETKNCSHFKLVNDYAPVPATPEEYDFPIAFSIIMHNDVDRAERLLRAIYQPQNFYCILIDESSSQIIHSAMHAVSGCFENVIIPKQTIDIKWLTLSVLKAELLCMEELSKYKWKYYINLTGQEYPLKTNWELVQILKAYNGANDVETESRWYGRALREEWFKAQKESPPVNVTIAKGSLHMAVQRGFVDYVLHDIRARKFLSWIEREHIYITDEAYFASLNSSPQLDVPGSYTGDPIRKRSKPLMTRYKLWSWYTKEYYDWYPEGGFPQCHGIYVRMICQFGVGDLPNLMSSPHMFANKFSKTFEPEAYDCLEAWHWNKMKEQYRGQVHFNADFYKSLDSVKHHI